ncbi:unnamed protein product [Rotaria sordida]|uniref:Uncharacterized protein n=1 Tax=Rotaria sordida TaxID=392033 RepID=A0A819NP40_9BILA|nr:unnamed protein product [Rotaria sordida]
MNSIFLFILLYGLVWIIDANHFLGGTITWRLLNESATGTPVAVVITQTYSWTYSLITCTTAQIASNQLIPIGSYTTLSTATLDSITIFPGGATGYVAPNIRPRCIDISASAGITVGQRSDTVNLQTGSDFAVAYQDRAWRPLASASTADWSVSSRINLTPRSDNGLYNNAPVATLMSPINIPSNQSIAINVPVADADGDTTRCRWSTSSNGIDECGDVEDFINSSSTTPLSSVPVQFLVQVVNSPACTIPPEIVGIPVEEACIPVKVGQTFNSQLIAINNCGSGVTIADIATLSFAGIAKGNIVKLNTTTYYKTLSWTPTTSQLGFQVMCAMAFNSTSTTSASTTSTSTTSTTSITSASTTSTSTTSTTSTTKTLRRRFWRREEDLGQQYRSQYEHDSAINGIEIADMSMKDYRRQYINESSWLPMQSFSPEESFFYSSPPLSDFGSSAATRTTLMSSLSDSILPSVDIPIQTARPLRLPYLTSGGSILVRAYIDQETKGDTFGH